MVNLVDKIHEYVATRDTTGLVAFMKENGLVLDNKHGTITYGNLLEKKQEAAYLDQSQHLKKIKLNSCYGSILSVASRFNDPRIGQSVTLSGRCITKHMSGFVNEHFTGEYDYLGETIIYNDTDSAYFSIWPTVKDQVDSGEITLTADVVIDMYDQVANAVNGSFPQFMKSAFNCPNEFGSIIKCGREMVASSAYFIVKKRYAAMMVDKDGIRYDVDGKPGKVKAMGLDLRRSDTPVIVQKFLKSLLQEILTSDSESKIIELVKEFKTKFKNLEPWEMGSPKRGNRLSFYKELIDIGKGNKVPGHVRAALNWNMFRELYKDTTSKEITDGTKLVVLALKKNPSKCTSIAYPIDVTKLPAWFTELPFDTAAMMASVVDKRIENLLCALPNWNDLERKLNKKSNMLDDFFS